MRIYADRLAESLNKSLHNQYLIFGNEALLIQESLDQITNKAKSENFDEIYRYQVDSSLDWDEVYDRFQALSLFSSKQVIELSLPESGVNATIAKHLVALSDMINPDIVFIICGTKLTKAQENTKWFKTLLETSILVNCLTPDLKRLPQFVLQRCQKMGLKPDSEAVQMLAQWHEGNLLALAQSLEKLVLLYPDGQLSLIRIEESLSRHNHFTVFNWSDAILEGKANRGQRVLRQLKAEGIEATILLRTIQKELLLLWQLKLKQQDSLLASEFDRLRIWSSKRPIYQAALNRLTLDKIKALIKDLTKIEILVKTQYSDAPWLALEQLSIEIAL